ncbi:MAG: RNA methyltransferase [Bacteroidales bacterium]|nr:RNA methyltransferase [Bacteroidales bacterium]
MDKITSLQNPRIKQVLNLSKSAERREKQLFIVEGLREIELALHSAYRAESIFICPEKADASSVNKILLKLPETVNRFEITPQVFEKMAYRDNSDGLIMVFYSRFLKLGDLKLSGSPFLIVMESVEKPGNLGAILRTADAARVDAVIVCDPQTDLFNPNVIRSGIGCLFTNQVVSCSSEEAFNYLHQQKINIYAAELKASEWYHEVDFRRPSAIVMGTEADGLTPFWLEHADARIKIPMRGSIDSLNVSVSTAILTFEAMRQRGF